MAEERILVPLDGSAFSEAALPVAATLASRLDAGLELVSVVDPRVVDHATLDEPVDSGMGVIPAGPVGTLLEDLEETLRGYLDTVETTLSGSAGVPVSSDVLTGLVAETLEERIEARPPGLVVMATHGRGPLSRAWLGSVADRLIRHVQVPVLLVRPDEEEEPDITARRPLRRILVPVDGSDRAEESVPRARRIGEAMGGATYTLLRVVPRMRDLTSAYLPETMIDATGVEEEARAAAAEYVEALESRLREEGLDARGKIRTGEEPAEGILREAEEGGADLIALATRGRGGISRLILGSVADKVVRGSSIPTLLVRPAEEREADAGG